MSMLSMGYYDNNFFFFLVIVKVATTYKIDSTDTNYTEKKTPACVIKRSIRIRNLEKWVKAKYLIQNLDRWIRAK